jgi:lipoyltransferase/lipoate-protein ligase
MILLTLPDEKSRKLPFFLAMEEWAARNLPPAKYFFTWIVEPTVICGRCQDVETEVDLDYCRRNGIDVVRRRSGGGTVYADTDNIMMSLVTDDTDINKTFATYTAMVAAQLRAMGIDARSTGRNDVVIGERKISGNAFYHLPGRSIAHGTMLYDTDPERMTAAITPSRAKLLSKKVVSVASHITTAREHRPELTIEEFRAGLTRGLTDSEICLTPEQVAEIEVIEQRYRDPEWLMGRERDRKHRYSARIDGVGEFAIYTSLDDNRRFVSVDLRGDFFLTDDLDEALLDKLKGVAATREAMTAALAGTKVDTVIRALSNEAFINLMLDATQH